LAQEPAQAAAGVILFSSFCNSEAVKPFPLFMSTAKTAVNVGRQCVGLS